MENNKKDDKKSMIEERLNRISSDFELDVLRLIKTQSMISSTSEIIDSESETVKKRSEEFQEILKDFSNNLLEKAKNMPAFENDASSQRDINEILSTIEDYRTRTRKIRDEVEQVTKENLSRLSSLHEFYSMELRAYQEGLDTKLQDLQKSIASTLDIDENELDLNRGIEYVSDEDIEEEYPVHKKPHTEPFDGKQDGIKEGKGKKHSIPGRYVAAFVLILLAVAVYVYQVSFQQAGINSYLGKTAKTDTNQRELADTPLRGTEAETVAGNKENLQHTATDTQKPEELEAPEDNMTGIQDSDADHGSGMVSETKEGSTKALTEEFPEKPLYTIRVRGANVRSGPGKGYDVVTVVRSGDTFEKSGEETDRWMKIRTETGLQGWIAKSLVKETEK